LIITRACNLYEEIAQRLSVQIHFKPSSDANGQKSYQRKHNKSLNLSQPRPKQRQEIFAWKTAEEVVRERTRALKDLWLTPIADKG